MRFMTHLRRCTAFVLATVILMLTPAALAAQGKVNTSSLIMRKAASKNGKMIQTLDKGDVLEVLSVSGDWYKVRYGKYTGYVMKKYVKVSGTVKKESTSEKTEKKQETSTSKKENTTTKSETSTKKLTIADLGKAPSASKPGDKGSKVKKLQQALQIKGYYKGKINSTYDDATTAAVKAFQKSKGLSRDGIAGKATINALFGIKEKETEKIKATSLKWFKNTYAIPKGATVTIKDVYTGKTFKAVRWSGANHMDTEPATKADTAIMKSIYGGSWSWKRRPILVKYKNKVYAASMNGMPHGTSTRNNGFDGHFCVHFTGSKTHETNRVDTEHQRCVKTALNYSW